VADQKAQGRPPPDIDHESALNATITSQAVTAEVVSCRWAIPDIPDAAVAILYLLLLGIVALTDHPRRQAGLMRHRVRRGVIATVRTKLGVKSTETSDPRSFAKPCPRCLIRHHSGQCCPLSINATMPSGPGALVGYNTGCVVIAVFIRGIPAHSVYLGERSYENRLSFRVRCGRAAFVGGFVAWVGCIGRRAKAGACSGRRPRPMSRAGM
jgi:hypothetical protein